MSSKTKISSWLYGEEVSGKFLMLPPEIFEEPAFQSLSHAARNFYILLNVHKQTEIQRSCLLKALRDYNQILDLGMTDDDLLNEATPNKRTKYTSGYFVIPQKQLKDYGYSAQYANKLKKELIAAGFIKVVFGGKGKYAAWNQNVTVYQFSSEWKSKHS